MNARLPRVDRGQLPGFVIPKFGRRSETSQIVSNDLNFEGGSGMSAYRRSPSKFRIQKLSTSKVTPSSLIPGSFLAIKVTRYDDGEEVE
jgi:hypothetical protein